MFILIVKLNILYKMLKSSHLKNLATKIKIMEKFKQAYEKSEFGEKIVNKKIYNLYRQYNINIRKNNNK